jgi:hypothetical protein
LRATTTTDVSPSLTWISTPFLVPRASSVVICTLQWTHALAITPSASRTVRSTFSIGAVPRQRSASTW